MRLVKSYILTKSFTHSSSNPRCDRSALSVAIATQIYNAICYTLQKLLVNSEKSIRDYTEFKAKRFDLKPSV
ncbi:hypothetical protein [Fischerella sp. PCC 9605]|uniref:hypothetical protein n=1 Tax=Fischerella sp. PCC 9605 TaxID=1173024 RepID=UPI0004B900AB|nr:hypothetical protein [Fischerella sp. PCC 9605]